MTAGQPLWLRVLWYTGMVLGTAYLACKRYRYDLTLSFVLLVFAAAAQDALPSLVHDPKLLSYAEGATDLLVLVSAFLYVRAFAATVGHQRVDLSVLRFRRRRPRKPDH